VKNKTFKKESECPWICKKSRNMVIMFVKKTHNDSYYITVKRLE